MKCTPRSSSAWVVAAPLFPFLVAAWAGGAARRKGGSSWCAEDRKPRSSRRAAACSKAKDDIVDAAAGTAAFSTLVEAVQAADLVDTLKGEGPFTVFAPTDDAFERLPEGVLDGLLEDKEKLASVLTYHVVPGRIRSSALASYAAMKTVQGGSLKVDTSLGLKVDSAYVVQPDIEASNGIIHAIDSVLLPT